MALRSSLQSLAKGLGVLAWEFVPRAGQLVWLEGPLLEWLGIEEADLEANPGVWLTRIHGADQRSALSAMRRAARAPQTLVLRVVGARGIPRALRVRTAPGAEPGVAVGWCERAEPDFSAGGSSPTADPRQIQASDPAEERYRAYVQQAQEAIWCLEATPPIPLDLEDAEIEQRIFEHVRLLEFNPAFEAAFLPPNFKDPMGRPVSQMPGTWLPAGRNMMRMLARTRFAPNEQVIAMQDSRGQLRSVRLRSESVVHKGSFQRIWCSAQDVTFQVSEAARQARSELESRTVLAKAVVGIAVLDERRRLVMYNVSMEDMLQSHLRTQVGQRFRLGASAERETYMTAMLDEARKQGRALAEFGLDRPAGETLEVVATVSYEEALDGRYYVVFRDVSESRSSARELRTKQRQLDQLQRLHTVGEMATRIAHELNQPLSAILNYTKGCLQRLPDDPDWKAIRSALHSASDQAQRAGASVKRLRSFVSQGVPVRIEIELKALLESAIELFALQPIARGHVLETDLELTTETILADPGQLQQVLMALLENAAEACTDQPGTITLTARDSPEEPSFVEIEIRDDGAGINESDIDRLFATFESTKPGSLGLGLSISRSIVEAHQGTLRCTPSGPGLTIFTIRFALAHPPS